MAHADTTAQTTGNLTAHAAAMSLPKALELLGGGGHALVVSQAAAAIGIEVTGFYDDKIDAVAHRIGGLTRLGGLMSGVRPEATWILAIGGIATRRSVLDAFARARGSARACTLIHPAACVAPTAEIGAGVFIGPNAIVQAYAIIGNHAIINSGAIVEHECVIGENVHIAPGTVLGGNVRVGRDTLVGIGSRVLPGIDVGAGATVGGGATVVRTVVAGTTVVGIPARVR